MAISYGHFSAETAEQRGHLLGRARQNPRVPTAVHNLSSIEASILRLLLHCTLCMAANNDPQVEYLYYYYY